MSTVGTIGFAGLVTQDLLPANIDRHAARIALNKNTIEPELLVAFLNSSFGKFQSVREATGNVQLNLFIDKIKEFKVPKINDPIILNLVKQSLNGRKESFTLYSQAEKLLLEELGLNDFKFEDDLSYVVNFSDVKSANRMDAEFFQPKYEKLISKLKAQKAKPFFDCIQNVPAKFEPLREAEKQFSYVELADINSSIGIIDGFTQLLGKEAPSRAKRVLKTGDVIVSSVEGSLEKVALVDKEHEGYLASTGFFQLRSKEILPEVLLVLAKSVVLQMQLQKYTAGTILSAVPKEAIKNLILPILPQSTQQKIADMVRKSHQARKRSKGLLEEAKRKVEEMIEKGAN